MHDHDISRRQHDHRFGQDLKKPGEARTRIVIVLTLTMMLVEIIAGIVYGSMALLADGIHMASHAVALGINAFAYVYARRHAGNPAFSFGTGKVNALGGYTGAVLLAFFALMMAWESVERLFNPTPIAFNHAILVAVVGLVVNGASVFILGDHHHHDHDHGHSHHHEDDGDHEDDHHHAEHHDHHDHDHPHHDHHHHHDHNLRSAYLHVLADALTSVTAIVALLAAKYFGWVWMDPLMGIVGSLLVGRWSLGLLRQTSHTLLDRQLEEPIVAKVRHAIEADGHSHVTDLHAWEIGPRIRSLIVSVAAKENLTPDDYRQRIDSGDFQHVTIEVHRMETESWHPPRD